MSPRGGLVAALAGVLLLLGAGAAGAHGSAPALPAPAPRAHAAQAASGAPVALGSVTRTAGVALWPWLAPLALLLAWGRRRAPRLLAVALALVFFAAESAVHSVHHGVPGDRTAVCPIASAAAHVAGADAGVVAVADPVPAVGPLLAEPGFLSETFRPLSPHQGRAPPSAHA